ncbi:MAG: antibiotic biosynthesis monooxygenase [Hyphomonadaceae bacterium]|nr:antibiotic biosynthesis monooxygenase [Hyphomonadaceae bacterium]MBX3510265.1 antibiotic biosynthesis monooxygenase [Hyphomonadaceae bacterium]
MIIVEGWIRLAPGGVEALQEALRAALETTRQEAGCISYACARDVLAPDMLRVSEIWADEAAMAAHARAPHTAAFMKALRNAKVEGISLKAYAAEYQSTILES